nr:MAG TPA: hypothetical protein [Caudoviricetes sp.]
MILLLRFSLSKPVSLLTSLDNYLYKCTLTPIL